MEQEGLHDYLDKQHQDANGRIKNDMQANCIIRKIEQLRDKKKQNKEIAKAERDKIKKWLDEVNGELDQQIKEYRNLIHQYMAHLRQKTKNPSLRTLKLPYGTIIFQKQKSKWHYDVDRLIEFFLETNQRQFVRVELNKDGMRKHFKEAETAIYDPQTGETLTGVAVEQQGEYFSVKRK